MGGALAFSKFSFQRRCCRRGRFRVFAFSIIVKTLSLRGAFIHEVRQKGMWYSSAVLVKRPLRGRQISSSERNEMPVCAAHLEKMQYSGVVVVECPPRGCQISSSERNEMPVCAAHLEKMQYSGVVVVECPPRGCQISSSERNEMPVCAAHLEKMQYSGVVVVECPPKGCQISSSERNEVPAGAVRPIYVQFYQKPAMNICLQFCVMCAIINKIELPRPQAQIDFSTSGGVFLCPEPAISRKQF